LQKAAEGRQTSLSFLYSLIQPTSETLSIYSRLKLERHHARCERASDPETALISAGGGDAADGDSSSSRSSETPRRFTHPELLLQQRAACRVGREDAVDITMQLPSGHLRLSAHDGLHQSIVDENILLLRGDG